MTIPTELLEYAGTPLSQWPDDLRQQVEANPELLRMMEEQARMASLMSLKRYEQPSPAASTTIRDRIQDRIQNGEAHPTPKLDFDALTDWVRMAAALVVMLGLSVLTHWEMIQNGDPSVDVVIGEPLDRSSQNTLVGFAPGATGTPGITTWSEPEFQPLLGTPTLGSGGVMQGQDPFQTFVVAGENEVPPLFQFSPDLARQIEASFEERSLLETNRVSETPLVPVRTNPAP